MRGTIVFIVCFLVSLACAVQPVVKTKLGAVSGKVLKTLNDVDYFGFMGIPFAKPPLKDFRFLPPQPIEPWKEVLVAIKEKPACIQYNYNVRNGNPFGIYGSEDCLYLDVYSPDINKKQPVLVFLYNEQFKNSYNKTKDYAPDFFIEENLIVVTISHRLSMFGFLSFDDNVLWGNSGLKDIVAGLEWIKENIEAFGGDPNKVTVMGAMGGGAAVDMLLHSNAKYLFHAAIIQGGSSYSSMYLQGNSRQRAFKFADALKVPSFNSQRTISDLYDISAEDLLLKESYALDDDYFKKEQKSLLPFGPVVENSSYGLLTHFPEESSSIHIPIMIGFNSGEGIDGGFQFLIEPRYISFVEKDFPLQMPLRVKFRFDPLNNAFYDAIEEIKAFYFPGGKRIGMKDIPKYVQYLGDVATSYAVDQSAKLYANISGKPVYYYHFNYESNLNENKNSMLSVSTFIEVPGAAAGDELCYLFKCPRLNNQYKKVKQYINIQRKMVRMWANFVKFGNPTPIDDAVLQDVFWEPFNLKDRKYLDISKELYLKSNLLDERFTFWDNFLDKWIRQAVNGVVSGKEHEKDEL